VSSFVDFLRGIHAHTPEDQFVELKIIPGPPYLHKRDAITAPHDVNSQSYYHGVLPRKAVDVVADGWIVWVDTDGSLTDPDEYDPMPTARVHSGRVNGYHLYWLLSSPLPPEKITLLSKLATNVHNGDYQVCHPKAALRVPDSINKKYDPVRVVKVEDEDYDREYEPHELEEKLLAALIAPHYNDGERHQLTMALAAILARAGWEIERARRVVTYLYEMNAGTDFRGKLKDVDNTFARIALGQIASTAVLRTALTPPKYVRLLEALGITARDGDIVIGEERIGTMANAERDFLAHLIDRDDWGGAVGKIVRWNDTHWRIQEDRPLVKEIFDILASARIIEQGDQKEFTATTKLATNVAHLLLGHYGDHMLPEPEPHYLPLLNGALNLRTLEIEPIQKNRANLWVVPLEYDPSAKCPEWERFIEEAAPHPAVRDHLQEWLGYMLMHQNRWQRLLWLYGPSGTGKSTYIKAIHLLLGDAATAVTTEKFSEYAIAGLAGKRAATCSELSPRLLRTSTIKALVGSDPLQGRHPYGRPFSVVFLGKMVWGSNELPPVDQGEGMWRRIVPIEFRHHPRWIDHDLEDKLKEEAAGVLNWAIQGLRRLLIEIDQGGGWQVPDSVKETIEQYKVASDPIIAFAREELDMSDPSEHVPLMCTNGSPDISENAVCM
jgi:P4 family phage/plasmid primase-like protien